jgi:hypothetical protein
MVGERSGQKEKDGKIKNFCNKLEMIDMVCRGGRKDDQSEKETE